MTPVDWPSILTLGLTGITLWTGAIWFLWSRIQVVNKSLTDIELAIAKEYVSIRHMRELEDRLTGAIDRLGDRLDRRLEKHA